MTNDVDEPGAPTAGAGLVRVRLDLSYDGSDFSGWARQPGRRTVEETLAAALAQVLRLAEPAALVVAGRTDAGVHATGQVVHADLPETDLAALPRRLRGVLPSDVVVRRAALAPPEFDARFSATGRTYRYRLSDQAPDPLRRHDTVAWPRSLDVARINAAAQLLVGEHDFAAYCRPREGATTVRTLRRLEATRDDGVVVTAAADAFCHNQVRSMVGALLAVGDGRRPVPWPAQVLAAGVRDSAVTVAPAHGLTLVAVDYPPDDEVGRRARQARQRRTPLSHPAAAR
ncbi:MAG TPA: tRNA pseudouridine(38-40) synthase TruA [Mycobacteriales bacterium]|nr:tRNA pseudouridine(38-40) synthase TruA [Mycobacteriales bacterium]